LLQAHCLERYRQRVGFRTEIGGVNYLLNGLDTSADFWPGLIDESHPLGVQHEVVVPEPSTAFLCLLSGAGLLAFRGRRKFSTTGG